MTCQINSCVKLRKSNEEEKKTEVYVLYPGIKQKIFMMPENISFNSRFFFFVKQGINY